VRSGSYDWKVAHEIWKGVPAEVRIARKYRQGKAKIYFKKL